MKNLILILSSIFILSCDYKWKTQYDIDKENAAAYKPPEIQYKTVTTYKVIKELKEINEVHTNYHYKFDILNGKFRQQPSVYSEAQYFIIFTDHTHKETNRNEWLNYVIGDSVAIIDHIPI